MWVLFSRVSHISLHCWYPLSGLLMSYPTWSKSPHIFPCSYFPLTQISSPHQCHLQMCLFFAQKLPVAPPLHMVLINQQLGLAFTLSYMCSICFPDFLDFPEVVSQINEFFCYSVNKSHIFTLVLLLQVSSARKITPIFMLKSFHLTTTF